MDLTYIAVDRQIGGKYSVSKLKAYSVAAYSVEYSTYKTGRNIFGTPMNELFPPRLETKVVYETRYVYGTALSHSMPLEDAVVWAQSFEQHNKDTKFISKFKAHATI